MKIINSILCIVALSALLFSFSGCESVKDRLELSVTDETAEAVTDTTVITDGITTEATTTPVITTEPSVPDIPDVPDDKSDVIEAARIVSEARTKTYEYDVDADGSISYEVPPTGMFDADINGYQEYKLLTHTDDNGAGSYYVSISDGTNLTSYTSVDGRIYIYNLADDENLSLKVVEIPDGEDGDIPDLTAFFGDDDEVQIPGLEGVTLDRLFGKAEIKRDESGSLLITFSEADAEFLNTFIMSLLTSGASDEETDQGQEDIMSGVLLEVLGSDAVIYDIQAHYAVNADGCLVSENLRISVSINVPYPEGFGEFAFEILKLETAIGYRTVEEGITITAPENADEYEEITLEELLETFDVLGETVTVNEETDN